jgi:DNA-binding transcriptional LysR family regulator
VAEIRQLRYFVAVAERRSMSQAALGLHLSQSALSEALRKLEVELGVELLERSSRGVAPTPAGEALVQEARAAIERFDGALDVARRAARGQAGRLRVGFEAAGAGRLSTQARARLIARFPHVRVEPRRFEWGGEVAALRDGE